jgi:hypothetical protein
MNLLLVDIWLILARKEAQLHSGLIRHVRHVVKKVIALRAEFLPPILWQPADGCSEEWKL